MKNNRQWIGVVALSVSLLTLLAGSGIMTGLVKDRIGVAVAMETQAVNMGHMVKKIDSIEGTLKILVDQQASIVAMQMQIVSLEQRLGRLEK